MVGSQCDRAPERVHPGVEALIRHRVDEVDADVGEARFPRQREGARGLRRVGLALEHRERARVESLHAEAEAVYPAIQPRGEPGLVRAGGVRLKGHLGVGRNIEVDPDELQQARREVGRQQAWRAASEVDGLQLLERKSFTSKDQLALQRVDVIGHQPIHAGVGVEVAVAALVPAEGNVQVQVPERLKLLSSPFMGRWQA